MNVTGLYPNLVPGDVDALESCGAAPNQTSDPVRHGLGGGAEASLQLLDPDGKFHGSIRI